LSVVGSMGAALTEAVQESKREKGLGGVAGLVAGAGS
jgi:hypothetical protein